MILFFLTSSSLIVQSKSNDKIHHLQMHITKNAGIILVNKWISNALLKAQNFMAQRLTCHTNFFKLWSIQYKKIIRQSIRKFSALRVHHGQNPSYLSDRKRNHKNLIVKFITYTHRNLPDKCRINPKRKSSSALYHTLQNRAKNPSVLMHLVLKITVNPTELLYIFGKKQAAMQQLKDNDKCSTVIGLKNPCDQLIPRQ